MLKNKYMNRSAPRKQRGMTLIELLVAGVISLIAAAGMIAVMANTLGTGTQTIKMTKLTQEMRTAMQIMSRELRRANYHGTYMACYSNMGCLGSDPDPNVDDGKVYLGIDNKIGEINITDNGDSDCLWFWYGRPSLTLANSQVAAFRRTTEAVDGVNIGKLQMTITETAMANCAPNANWVDITDSELVDITAFNVSDTESVVETINSTGETQSVERIALEIMARLRPNDGSIPDWLQTGNNLNAERRLQEFITVRNHTTAVP